MDAGVNAAQFLQRALTNAELQQFINRQKPAAWSASQASIQHMLENASLERDILQSVSAQNHSAAQALAQVQAAQAAQAAQAQSVQGQGQPGGNPWDSFLFMSNKHPQNVPASPAFPANLSPYIDWFNVDNNASNQGAASITDWQQACENIKAAALMKHMQQQSMAADRTLALSPDMRLLAGARNLMGRNLGDSLSLDTGRSLSTLGGSAMSELSLEKSSEEARVSKVRCQVANCDELMINAKEYHRRHRVCEAHAKSNAVLLNGCLQRFCQQCSRFHPLLKFDSDKRSCRSRLMSHNHRRRKLRKSNKEREMAKKDHTLDGSASELSQPSSVTADSPRSALPTPSSKPPPRPDNSEDLKLCVGSSTVPSLALGNSAAQESASQR